MSAQQEITQRDLRGRSAEIMQAVADGESFTVTRSGTPVGELVPLQRRRYVTREQFLAMSEHAPAIDLATFRSDMDEVADVEISDPYAR